VSVEFKWIEWNRAKIAAHNLSATEVEHAWYNRYGDDEYEHPIHGAYYESFGPCPSGRVIKIVWRWDMEGVVEVVFVITAFGHWREP
jgi:hypothetical protein